MTHPRRHSQRGFTLFEVLISLTILVGITTLVYTSLSGTLRMTELAEEDEATVNGARVAMARMQRELAMAFLDPRVYRGRRTAGTLVETWKTAFKGEASSPIDKLSFTTFSHVRLYHGSTEGDQTEISWYGEPDEESSGLYQLMHREAPRIDAEPEEGGVVEVLARGVQELKITYYDPTKEEWIEDWDNEAPEHRRAGLPKAVALSLVLVDSEGEVHHYRTRVQLQLYRPLPVRFAGFPPRGSRNRSQSTTTQGNRKPRRGSRRRRAMLWRASC